MIVTPATGAASPLETLPTVCRVFADGMNRIHFGMSLYVSRRGTVIANAGIGESRPGSPVTPDLIVPWLSAGKPLTAAAVLQLTSDDSDLDEPVSHVIPEFRGEGKSDVTIGQLLTHTSGLPLVDTAWPDADWPESLRRVCEAEWPAGTSAGSVAAYQPSATWFLLGEWMARKTGRSFFQTLSEQVLTPCGMTETWCGMTDLQWETLRSRLGPLYERDRSGALASTAWDTHAWCTAPSPGANCRGTVQDLGRFYEAMLNNDRQSRFPHADRLRRMTSRIRQGQYDKTLQQAVDYGYGVIVDSNRYGGSTVPYGFGRFCSEETFGHGGSQCAMGFADPEHGLVVVWAANGRPGEPQHQKRNRSINEAIYQDLGLTGASRAPG